MYSGNTSGGVGLQHVYTDSSRLLYRGLLEYHSSGTFSDVAVIAPNGRRIRCHQLVLSACSKQFAGALESGEFTNSELPVQGVDADALEQIISFFYSGECPITVPTAIPLLDAAIKLDVPGLTAACEQFVNQLLHPLTAVTFMSQSLAVKLDTVTEVLSCYITGRFVEVTQSTSWMSCDYNTFTRVMLDNKSQQNEQSLFKAAYRWLLGDSARSELADGVFRLLGFSPATVQAHMSSMQSTANKGGAASNAAAVMTGPKRSAEGSTSSLRLSISGLLPQAIPSMSAMPTDFSDGRIRLPQAATPAAGARTPPPHLMAAPGAGAMVQPLNPAYVMDAPALNGHQSMVDGGGSGSAQQHSQRIRSPSEPASGQTMPSDIPTIAREPPNKGVCHVEGCGADLTQLREYHQRFKICDYHLKVGSVLKDGVEQRFCQQCGRFHLLSEFDGAKRSCRSRLQRHNARRRKRAMDEAEELGLAGANDSRVAEIVQAAVRDAAEAAQMQAPKHVSIERASFGDGGARQGSTGGDDCGATEQAATGTDTAGDGAVGAAIGGGSGVVDQALPQSASPAGTASTSSGGEPPTNEQPHVMSGSEQGTTLIKLHDKTLPAVGTVGGGSMSDADNPHIQAIEEQDVPAGSQPGGNLPCDTSKPADSAEQAPDD